MTIRPSSRSNGTGPARGYSRAGVTEVSGRRPGAGPSALEQTGEGTASTRRRRRRQIRPAETRLSARNRLRNPVPQGAGLFYGCGGTRRRPGGRRGRLLRVPGNRSGTRGTGRPPPADRNPTSTHHTTTTKRRTSTEPIILRVCRAAKGLRSGGTRPGSGPRRVTRTSRASRVPRGPRGPRGERGASGTSGASEPHGGRGARGTSGREVLERSKRSRGDLRKKL